MGCGATRKESGQLHVEAGDGLGDAELQGSWGTHSLASDLQAPKA